MALRVVLIGMLALCTSAMRDHPSAADCEEMFFPQQIDHFNWATPLEGSTTYLQRYFKYDKYWKKTSDGRTGPIFFYLGNEDTVTLYVNNTGLMWENAEKFGALLIFAEHRYYGKSFPYPDSAPEGCLQYFTTEQALADFAILIDAFRGERPAPQEHNLSASTSPIIGFGGSYGGMLASWFRMKYPNAVDGVIAASAPILSFVGMNPPYDPNAFDNVIAASMNRTSAYCVPNVRSAQSIVLRLAESDAGRKIIAEAFRTCAPLNSASEARGLIGFITDPWSNFAMGMFPYPSSYLMHGKSFLPAWPLKVACAFVDRDFSNETDAVVMAAVRDAVAVYYNNTGTTTCFYNGASVASASPPPRPMRAPRLSSGSKSALKSDAFCGFTDSSGWGYQYCTEILQPFSSGGGSDISIEPNKFDLNETIAGCWNSYGVVSRPYWLLREFGGNEHLQGSNIVFSNGAYDPWHAGGVLRNVSDSVVSIMIHNGGHHTDLMFSDPADTPDITSAREFELQHIEKWIQQAYANQRHQ